MKTLTCLTLLALAISAQAGTSEPKAPAAPPPISPAPADGGWWFRVAPYGWLTAIDGDITVGPLSSPVDISMADTLDSVDMSVMGIVEAGYDRWSLGVDFVYGKVSQDIGAGGRRFDSFRLEQKQWLVTPYVAYRVVETDRYAMDLYAGAMFTVLDVELTGRLAHGGELSRTNDTDWVDPVIGIRGQGDLSEKFFFRYNGFIGGFGTNSDFVWEAFLGLGYRVNSHLSLAAGYRGLGIDYSDGGFSMDTVTHGPVLGFEVKW